MKKRWLHSPCFSHSAAEVGLFCMLIFLLMILRYGIRFPQGYPVLQPAATSQGPSTGFHPFQLLMGRPIAIIQKDNCSTAAGGLGSGAPYPDMVGPGFSPMEADQVQGTLYLTFDDGPSENTDAILDILDQYGIKATFFVVPNRSQACMERLQKIHARGHTIGVHSFSHDYTAIYSDVSAFLEDFAQAYQLILQATGEPPELFRFPGGSKNAYNRDTRQAIMDEMTQRGFVYFDWNVSAQDAQNGITWEQVYQNVMDSLGQKQFGVVLLHDSYGRQTTVQALPRLIETLLARGYRFDRLSSQVPPVHF